MEENIDFIQIHIYWIESHLSSLEYKTYISDENNPHIEIKPLYSSNEIKSEYIFSVYELVRDKKNHEFTFYFESESNEKVKYQKKLELNEKELNNQHIFLYDFVHLDCLSREIQFQLYLNMIDFIHKDDGKKKNEVKTCLLKCTKNYIISKDTFDFILYISSLIESSNSNVNLFAPYISLFLLKFKKEIKISNLSKENLEKKKSSINNMYNQFDMILLLIEEEKQKKKISEILYKIFFVFNYFFQPEKLEEMFQNKIINKTLFKFISIEYNKFKDLKLTKAQLIEAIKEADDFEKIENLFHYNDNFLYIIEAIVENIEKIKILLNQSKKVNLIKLEKYIKPKESDNIEEIAAFFTALAHKMVEDKINSFFYISPEIIKTYIEYNNLEEYKILKSFKELIDSIQSIQNYFRIKDFEKRYHEIFLKFIDSKKFSNYDLLEFILNDKYYSENEYEKYRDFTPLEALNLNKITNEDFDLWKKINWLTIFKNNQIYNFIGTICSLIKSLEDFGKVIDLLINDIRFKTHRQHILTSIQNKLLSDFKNESFENLTKNLYIIQELAIHSSVFNCKTQEFLENISQIFDKNFVMDLFITLIDEQKIIEKHKTVIKNYIDKDINSENPEKLYNLLKYIGDNDSSILIKLIKFYFDEDSFFTLEENLKIKLLKLLVIGRVLPKQNTKNSFLKYCFEQINNTKIKLNNYKYSYNKIYPFFENEKNILIFKERVGLLYLININDNNEDGKKYDNEFVNKKEEIESIIEYIKIRFEEITDKINILELIINDIKDFYPTTLGTKIGIYYSYINTYKTGNFFQEEKEFLKIKNDFLVGAERRDKIKDSLLFKSIYEKEKIKYKNEEVKAIIETEEKFKHMENVLNLNINEIDENILKICIDVFKNKEEKEIREEISKLAKIFNKNIDLDKMTNNYLLLSYRDNIFKVLNAAAIFAKKIGVKKNTYFINLDTIKSFCEKNNDIELIKVCLELLRKLGIDLKDNKNKFQEVLIAFEKNPESINYLLSKNLQDCSILHEIVNNGDEDSFLTSADVIYFEKCIKFIKSLGNEEELKKMTAFELLTKANRLFNEIKDKNSELCFINYVENYPKIKELVKNVFNKSEALKQTIDGIFYNSTFTLTNIEKEYFNGFYKIELKNEKESNKMTQVKKYKKVSLNLKNMQEFAVRIQISKKFLRDLDKKEESNIFQNFIDLMNDITNIIHLLNDIHVRGYVKTIHINIKINNSIKKYEIIIDNLKENYKEKGENIIKKEKEIKDISIILSKLKELRKKLIMSQKKGYKEKEYMRYIFGRQFNFLYDYIKKKENTNKYIENLFRYITNNRLSSVSNNYEWKYNEKEDEFQNIINNFNQYIQHICEEHNINIEEIYKNSKIISEEEYKGFYLFTCEDSLEKKLFQLYKYLTGGVPVPQNILLCNSDTSKEEIESFLYRAIFCKYHSCFLIGGIESLEFEPKKYFIEFLNEIIPKHGNSMISCLIILSADNKTDVHKSLDLVENRQFLNIDSNKIKNISFDEKNNISMYSSDKSGVGKSLKIKNYILKSKNNNNYIYFPLSGDFSRTDIINRLEKLNLQKKASIHLDLGDTDNIELMNEFLFEILILKSFKQNEKIIILPEDIKIIIEIPNGFINFEAKFPILTLIPDKLRTKLSIKSLDPLKVSEDVNSNIQIVCNYLKLRKEKKINDVDIIFFGITEEDLYKEKKKIFNINIGKILSTYTKAKKLEQKECQELIFEAFKENKNDYPSYYQINSFIDVLAVQLKIFNNNYYLNPELFKNNQLKEIRSFIIEGFINLTRYFTKAAYTKLLNEQLETHKMIYGRYNEEVDIYNGLKHMARNENNSISYKKINSTLIFFHEGEEILFKIITKKPPEDIEYKSFLRYLNSQDPNAKITHLPNYENFTQEEFYKFLQQILNINNPIQKPEKDIFITNKEGKKIKLLSIEEICKNYVFTADNLIKMILILIRIRSKVPVIMMGETGCGKTSLIKKLSELLNNGSSCGMKTIEIHAGFTDNDIIEKIKEFEKDAEELEKDGKTLWIFFDEINTCKSMGLISEIICKRSYHGEKIRDNITFIAACNPYRYIDKNKRDEIALNINLAYKELEKVSNKERQKLEDKSKRAKLVYTVNPLPHSLLNFVFDFGSLDKKDEQKYIQNMIEKPFTDIFNQNIDEKEKKDEKKSINNNNNELKRIKDFAINMLIAAQNFIRDKTDVSAVSLREIRKFIIFYKFFVEYLKFKRENYISLNLQDKEFKYQSLTNFMLQIYSINLSIFMCYYLRLTNKNLRNELAQKLNGIFKKAFPENENFKDFLYIPKLEENFIADNIDIPKGIAKNKALLENIFSLFCCINNKMPIFIVGKPGCSKSLSFELILKSMKGEFTDNIFFKNYPNLMPQKYQGSLCSQSEEILNIFEKAKKSLTKIKKNELKNYIAVIYFDEMGLAEHSKFNPLKTLHAKLEIDEGNEDEKIAFVGISNWSLDASKMNRGIHISISDLDIEDNIETALTIAESYDKSLTDNDNDKKYFEILGKTYFNYKKNLSKETKEEWKKEFHGLRDFYFFVKLAANKRLLELSHQKTHHEKDIWLSGIESIERNFSGLKFDKKSSVELVKENYIPFIPDYIKNTNINNYKNNEVKMIHDNIFDPKSRYLLVISKPSISCHLLKFILKDKKYSIFFGSKFKQDFKNQEYHYKIMNKIQVYMEKGGIIILKDFDYIYPALYDLLNQNFTVVTNRNFARISIGTSSTYYFVNDDFKCIIIVDNDKIENQEIPFINRFEKHILSYENLLSNKLLNEANEIYNIFSDLINHIQNYKIIKYDVHKLLINFEKEEIQGLIYEANQKGIQDDQLKNEIFSKFALTLPQDIIFFLKNIQFEFKDLIIENYIKGEHQSLSKFLSSMGCSKNIIYTFSTDLDVIKNLKNINNKNFGFNINEENIKKIKIRGIKTENILEKEIEAFMKKDKYKVCLIQFTPEEAEFMNYIKFFIEFKEKETEIPPKIYIFIVHMNRIFNNQKNKNVRDLKETISFLSDYYQIFIDNLNGDEKIELSEVIKSKNEELFERFFNLDEEIKNNIFKTTTYMNYNISSSILDLNKNNYVETMKSFIRKDEIKIIRKLINNCIKKKLIKDKVIEILYEKKEKENEKELEKNRIINDNEKNNNLRKIALAISEYDIDLIRLIKKYIHNLYISAFNRFIFIAENDNFFSSLLSLSKLYHDFSAFLSNINEEIIDKIDSYEIKLEKKTEKNIIFKLIEIIILYYFRDFSFDKNDTKFIEKQQGANNINITLGLFLPGYKKTIEDIINNIKKNIIYNYYINEREQFNLEGSNNKKPEEVVYLEKLRRFNIMTKNEIIRPLMISRIHEKIKEDKIVISQFYNLFINDYLIIYILENVGNNIDTNIAKLFFKNRKEKEQEKEKILDNDILLGISRKINFIECYDYPISFLLKIYIQTKNIGYELSGLELDTISDSIDNLNKIIISFITENISKIIFYIYIKKLKDKGNEINILSIIEYLENIYQNMLKTLISLNANNNHKEICTFKEISIIFLEFFLRNIKDMTAYTDIMQIFNYKTTHMNNDNIKIKGKILDNFNKLFIILNEKIGKNQNYPKIMNFILKNEYELFSDGNIRSFLIDTVLSNNEFLKDANLESILSRIFITHNIIKNLEKLDIKNEVFECLDKKKDNQILDEILISYFDKIINSYFTDLEQINKGKNKEKIFEEFINDEPYEGFIKTINIFTETYENKDNYYLKKLYSITYIKKYLFKLVNFIHNNAINISFKNINDLIENIVCEKYRNIIKLYIYKLFYFFIGDEENFINYNYEHKNITIFNNFKLNLQKNKINFYNFLPRKSLKELCQSSIKLFEEYKEEDYTNEEKAKEFANKINDPEVYCNITINKIISKLGLNDIYEEEKYANFFLLSAYVFSSMNIKEFLSYFLIYFYDKEKFTKVLKPFLIYFYDKEKFTKVLKPKLLIKEKDNHINGFIYLLYGMRYCFQSLEKKNKNFYFSLLQNEIPKDNINNIPGAMIMENKNEIIEEKLKSFELKFNDDFNAFYSYKYKNLLEIRYMILNFILCSYLFFVDCKGEKEKELKALNIIPDNFSYIENMKGNFDLLSERLKIESVDSIEIFMNLIFDNLSNLIVNSGSFKTEKEKIELENSVDKILLDSIYNFHSYKSEYIMENYELLKKENIDKNYLIVKELTPLSELNDDIYRYFMLDKIQINEKNFENYIFQVGCDKCQMKYPLLSQIFLFPREDIEKLN